MADSAGRNVMVQGRIVWINGDLFKGKIKTIFGTQTPVMDQQGQPVKEYGFGLAVPKASLALTGPGQAGEIWTAIHEEAFSLYPSRQLPPGFSMKYKDGDGVDHNGAPFAQRDGYAGHLIFTCTTQIPIKFFKWENGQNILINEGIKCGDYVNVQLMVKAHSASGAGKPGLYLNPNAVQFLGYGKEIVNSVSGDQIFGTQAPPVPQGASPTPIAPQEGLLVPPAMPTFAAPTTPPPAAAQPHYGVLPQAHQPAAPVTAPNPYAPPSMPAPAGYAQPLPQQPGMPVPGIPGMPQYQNR